MDILTLLPSSFGYVIFTYLYSWIMLGYLAVKVGGGRKKYNVQVGKVPSGDNIERIGCLLFYLLMKCMITLYFTVSHYVQRQGASIQLYPESTSEHP